MTSTMPISVTSAPPQVSKAEVEERLTEPLSEGYKPSIPSWALGHSDEPMPQLYLYRDVERMMIHSHVAYCLQLYCSGIAGAEFWGGPDTANPDNVQGLPICPTSPEVGQFVMQQCNRYWDRGVPKLQGSYPYGWIAGEPMYVRDAEGLAWDDLIQFSPLDSFLLTLDDRPIGVQVKQIHSPGHEGKGKVDLWFATKDVPAKALWYPHRPRYNAFFGQSQLLTAWRDWRRLCTKNAAETVLDGGFFRLGYRCPMVRYPDEDLQVVSPVPGTSLDSQGRPRRPARDLARQISEQMQAGAAMGMPSKQYPPELGGGPMWDIQDWGGEFDGTHLIAYVEHLLRRIAAGIGVPWELIEAQEGGSGYSGRAIPMESFLTQQQQIADAMLRLFVHQVLRPLVRWRYGAIPFNVECRPLLETKRKQQAGGELGNKPGVSPAMPPPALPGTHQGDSHHPHVGQNPPPGMIDRAGSPTSPYAGVTQAPFSVGQVTKAQLIAQTILSMGRAA